MKKFTNLEDELLKENLQVIEKYNNYISSIFEKMDLIKIKLNDFKNEKLHWGHIGSIAHIDEKMDEIMEHLDIKDMLNTTKNYNL